MASSESATVDMLVICKSIYVDSKKKLLRYCKYINFCGGELAFIGQTEMKTMEGVHTE